MFFVICPLIEYLFYVNEIVTSGNFEFERKQGSAHF